MTGHPSFMIYIMARTGKLDDVAGDPGFQATLRVMNSIGLDTMDFNSCSAQPAEEQFWEQFDGLFKLSEATMRDELPVFVTDPNNRAAVEALLGGAEAQIE